MRPHFIYRAEEFHIISQPLGRDLRLEGATKRAVADQHETRRRYLLQDEPHGPQQHVMALLGA
jgi:hypothetical protein